MLSRHLGFDTVITLPKSIAEIVNQDKRALETRRVEGVVLRRQEAAMNQIGLT